MNPDPKHDNSRIVYSLLIQTYLQHNIFIMYYYAMHVNHPVDHSYISPASCNNFYINIDLQIIPMHLKNINHIIHHYYLYQGLYL